MNPIIKEAVDCALFSVIIDFIKDPNSNLSFGDNYLLTHSAKNGYLGIVKRLLNEPPGRIDLSANYSGPESSALGYACEHGHYEIVKALMKDPRIDFPDGELFMFRLACKNGRTEIVKFLLKNSKVDFSNNLVGIFWAVQNENKKLLKIFLEDGREDPTQDGYFSISKAYEMGSMGIVSILSDDQRIDNRVGLKIALKHNQIEVVKFLMWKLTGQIFLLCRELTEIVGDMIGVIQALVIKVEMERVEKKEFGTYDLKVMFGYE